MVNPINTLDKYISYDNIDKYYYIYYYSYNTIGNNRVLTKDRITFISNSNLERTLQYYSKYLSVPVVLPSNITNSI